MTSTSDNQKNEPGAAGDKLGCGLALLVFVFPLVGLALYLVEGKTKPERARSAGQMALNGLVFGVILLGMLAMAVPVIHQNRENPLRSQCQDNLKQVSLAMMHYAQDWDGRLPDLSSSNAAREALNGYYESHVFTCPSNEEPYQVNGSLTLKKLQKIENPKKIVLFYEAEPVHYNGRNVCFADGKVTWLKEENWLEAKQRSGIDTTKP